MSEPAFTLYRGDALEALSRLPSESVDCVLTSPPYYRQRDNGHPDQLGQEASPEEYVTRLVAVFSELGRVLRSDGVAWLVIDDTYEQKALLGVPWRVALALQDDGWIIRGDCVWSKPNAPPESAKDRPTRSHEYVFLLTRQRRYRYQQVKEPAEWRRWGKQTILKTQDGGTNWIPSKSKAEIVQGRDSKNLRSVWTLPTANYPGAHTSVFPEELAEIAIRAGCPEGGTVLDPFLGSGTTAVVARKLGRNCIGIELSPDNCTLAASRV